MKRKQKPAPALQHRGGQGRNGTVSDSSRLDFSTLPGWRQARIAPLLGRGQGAAITARQLAAFLHAGSEREISKLIQRERAAGIPICASCDSSDPGYYLPETTAELDAYIKSLQGRHDAMGMTLRAVKAARSKGAAQ